MQAAGIETMTAQSYENYWQSETRSHWDGLPQNSRNLLEEGVALSGDALDTAMRLVLRELAWCKFLGARDFFVHFGYEFYMYIGTPCADVPALPDGIYCEPFQSPFIA